MAFVFRPAILASALALALSSTSSQPIAAQAPPAALETLTERETDVLRLLAQGKANKEIAAALFIGENTVKTHVSSILVKLGVQSRTQAALYARQIGLGPIE